VVGKAAVDRKTVVAGLAVPRDRPALIPACGSEGQDCDAELDLGIRQHGVHGAMMAYPVQRGRRLRQRGERLNVLAPPL